MTRRIGRGPLTAWTLSVLAAAVLVVGNAPSQAAFTSSIGNSTDTVTMGYLRCRDAQLTTGAIRLFPLDDAAGTLADDLSSTAVDGTYQGGRVVTAAAGGCRRDPVGYASTDATHSVSTGAQGYTIISTSNFSLEIWFRTTTRQGLLTGFGTSQTGASTTTVAPVMINSAGHLAFGVNDGTAHEIVSPAVVTDGQWHHVVATYSGASGISLYLDGAPTARNTTYRTGSSGTVYLRIGYDNTSAWTNGSTTVDSQHFTGNLSNAALYRVPLTADQVLNLYRAGSS